jgi:hypothetical protein
MKIQTLFIVRLISLSVLFQAFLLSGSLAQQVRTGDFFKGRKSISGIVANPIGNRPYGGIR